MATLVDERCRNVLAKASRALGGREVAVWTADGCGGIRPLATSSGRMPPSLAALALAANLRRWRIALPAGQSWVALHGAEGRWYVAPVRAELPTPPPLRPAGAERRAQERLALELTGLCIGSLEARSGAPDATRLERILEQGTLIWTTDRALRVTTCTGPGAGSRDAPPECVPGASLMEQFERGAATPQAYEAHKRALLGESASYGMRVGARYYDARVDPLRDGGSAVVGVMGVAHDATDREHAREAARRAEEELDSLFQHARLPMHWTTADGTILRANDAALELVGYAPEEYIGRNIARFHEDPRGIEKVLRRVAEGGEVENREARLMHKDGTLRRVLISATGRFENGQLRTVRVVLRDVTERKAVERRRAGLALHDALTNLPNRAFFVERLAVALERARRDPDYRFAVLLVDADDFTTVNDRLGRASGDRLLVEIAERLRRCMRPGDLVARLGEDQFTVLIDDAISASAVEGAARRLGDQLVGPYTVNDATLDATVTIAAVMNESGSERPEDLLRDAVIALYRAKADGRAQGGSRFRMFDITMRASPQARVGVEADLRRALGRDEFHLVFDPIVTLATGHLHAFEALLRWQHPARGVVQPLEFLPLAEQTGAIVPIGRWVLHEACRHARAWRETTGGAPVRVTVNVSGNQLNDPRFLSDVEEAMRDAGMAGRGLGLEVPESVLLEEREPTTAILKELRRLEVEVHMDHFGTRLSALGSLPRLQLDWIKVDRSCVHRIGARRTDLEIVRAIVERSKGLGFGVIAEGVETGAQRAQLMAFGCELGQGFRFADPLQAKEVALLLADRARGPGA